MAPAHTMRHCDAAQPWCAPPHTGASCNAAQPRCCAPHHTAPGAPHHTACMSMGLLAGPWPSVHGGKDELLMRAAWLLWRCACCRARARRGAEATSRRRCSRTCLRQTSWSCCWWWRSTLGCVGWACAHLCATCAQPACCLLDALLFRILCGVATAAGASTSAGWMR